MYRLIYKSRSKKSLDWDIVKSITAEREEYNSAKGITGVLLASRTHFLQVIEGNFEDVNAVFRRIVRDERHTDMSIISFSVMDARLFSAWGMRGIGTFDFNRKLESELMHKYGEEEGGVHFPLEEWQALALINDIKMTNELPQWKR